MGKKVVLAPRNSAEAVALGVSACFLAVAGVVVHGNSAVERSSISTQNLAAQVQDVRTVSRPSASSEHFGSRVPSVLVPEPPLVLLPVEVQAEAKIEAAGTPRGEGVVLVAWSRGAGTLSLGGGLTGLSGTSSSANRPNGAVGFPSTSAPGTVTAAPLETTPPQSSAPPTPAESNPAETTPAETTPAETTPTTPAETTPTTPAETTPTTPAETTPAETTPTTSTTSPPPEETTPTVSTTPTTSPPPAEPGTGSPSGDRPSGDRPSGGRTDSGAGGASATSPATDSAGTSEQDATAPVVPAPREVVAPGPTPVSLSD